MSYRICNQMKVSPVLPGPDVCRISSMSADVVLGSEVSTALKAVAYIVIPQIKLDESVCAFVSVVVCICWYVGLLLISMYYKINLYRV